LFQIFPYDVLTGEEQINDIDTIKKLLENEDL
jgi:hypothetical protein